MALDPGTRLGPYEIESPIGAGGMGEVYRATDTRLNRTVAIKVLPEHLASNLELRQRFEREARAVSSLNHPNICTLHDVGQQEGVHYLVMEHLEGETLAGRLEKGLLPHEEALRRAIEIGDALDKAHRQGVVHRDLKPGNIMLTRDGTKLLDFGLAKSTAESAPPISSVAMTQASPLTVEGSIVGTFQYMSPEQLEGKAADARSDIFSFGAVLYEMLTGKRAFAGQSQASLIAGILEREPPALTTLQPAAPRALDRVVKRCLAKEPDDRWQSAGDLTSELKWIAKGGRVEESAEPGAAPRRSPRELLAWALVVLLAATAAWFALTSSRGVDTPATRLTTSVLPPGGAGFDIIKGLTVSPDGSQIVFAARGEDGIRRLWIRPLESNSPRVLAGTDGARHPFWSPDSRNLAFFADGKLKKMEIAAGLIETITSTDYELGGAWSEGGDIVFTSVWGQGLVSVSASGGTPSRVTEVETVGVDIHVLPVFLPDGKHFLYLVRSYGSEERMGRIRIGSLDGTTTKELFPSNSNALYAPPGYLLWWHEGNLRAQRFDADRLELVGEPFPLVPDVRFDPRSALASVSVSTTGMLVYQEGGAVSGNELVWYDREGNEIGTLGSPGSLYGPRLSPDGQQVALDVSGETNQGDIWLLDVERGRSTRFSVFPEDDTRPLWSPDGEEIVFESMAGGSKSALYVRPSKGGPDPRLLVRDPEFGLDAIDWSRTGHLLVLRDGSDSQDLYLYTFANDTLEPYVATSFREWDGSIAPGDRYAAYVSDETGRPEIYVQTFPEAGARWSVSTQGGQMPLWNPDGTELFYLTLDGRMMAVPVSGIRPDARSLELGEPEELFRVDIKEHGARQYDTRDGRRFLVNRNLRAGAEKPLTLVLNWQAALDR